MYTDNTTDCHVSFRARFREKELWARQAEKEGRSLAGFIRWHMNQLVTDPRITAPE